jgi:hypothetical protein
MTIPFRHPVVCPILIGRSAELAALQECIESTARGQGGVVVLSGEAGIGKSRLVAELQRSAAAQDFQLLGGQCFPTDRSCPYALSLTSLGAFWPRSHPTDHDGAGIHTRALFLASWAGPAPARTRKPPQIVSLNLKKTPPLHFAQTSSYEPRLRPLLLVIEDIHWSDETPGFSSSSRARRRRSAPVNLTYRAMRRIGRCAPCWPVRPRAAEAGSSPRTADQDRHGDGLADHLARDAFAPRRNARCPL